MATGWMVQGMGRYAVAADWPPLSHHEVGEVLAAYPVTAGHPFTLRWRSPRPFSAAALVDLEPGRRPGRSRMPGSVFVKRHHRRVRTVADLGVEHLFSDHLRAGGVPVPEVLRTAEGEGGHALSRWTYEIHAVGVGQDRYRDSLSWTPYDTVADASAAGHALGRLHSVAAGFEAPARSPGVLVAGAGMALAADLVSEVAGLMASRPFLSHYLQQRRWEKELTEAAGALPERRSAAFRGARDVEAPQWTHGDWHGSNLLWEGERREPRVSAVLDLGLANRTAAIVDVAIAVERSAIGWLDLTEGRSPPVDLAGTAALIDSYRAARPAPLDMPALVALLPVVHLDFALSEVEYFAGVLRRPALADLAWDGYLLGHLRWWRSGRGSCFQDRLLAMVVGG